MSRGRLAIVAALALVVGACGQDEETTPQERDAPDAFVALKEGADEVVAISLLDDGRVEAFVCDGQQTADYFEGELAGSRFTLKSEGGGRLEGTVRKGVIEGRYTGAAELRFEALPNDEAAIYLATLSPRGTLDGESTAGGAISGQLRARSLGGVATYPSGDGVDFNGRLKPGYEVPAAELAIFIEGEIQADTRAFVSFYGPDGARSRAQPPPGDYRLLMFDGYLVGASAGAKPQAFVSFGSRH